MNDEFSAFPPIDEDVIVITGPTASGKSSVALEVAERIGAEIISVDSIAVYRGMDIGTAKPNAAQRARVPHHLLDVASPADSYSVATFLADTWRAIDEIRGRGRAVMLVGGTPMYLKGLLHGFDPGPPADWEFRQAIEADLAAHGREALRQRLWQADPLTAHRLDPNDTRRMIRALEVVYLTGRPLSHRQTQFERLPTAPSGKRWTLHWPRPELHARIERRVAAMFSEGLVDEVRGLLAEHGELSRTARIAVGYREVIDFLAGRLSESQMQAEVIAHSRQLARRQETWLRSLAGLTVCEPRDEASLGEVTGRIMEELRRGARTREPGSTNVDGLKSV